MDRPCLIIDDTPGSARITPITHRENAAPTVGVVSEPKPFNVSISDVAPAQPKNSPRIVCRMDQPIGEVREWLLIRFCLVFPAFDVLAQGLLTVWLEARKPAAVTVRIVALGCVIDAHCPVIAANVVDPGRFAEGQPLCLR